MRIRAELATPEAIADQHGGRPGLSFLVRREIASESRSHAPHLQEPRGDEGAREFFRQLARCLGEIFRVETGDRLKGGVQAVPIRETRWRCDRDVEILGVSLVDGHEPVSLGERQWPEQDRLDCRKDGAIGADAETEGRDHDGGKARMRATLTPRVPDVRGRAFDPGKLPRLTGLFMHAEARTKFAPRAGQRLGAVHAIALQVVCPALQVKLDLHVQFGIEARPSAEMTRASGDSLPPAHDLPPSWSA
jgi:hypothetical protein